MSVLDSPWHRLLDRSLLVLEITGRVSGRPFRLPVQYAPNGSAFVVFPARPETKQWWRNIAQHPDLGCLHRGTWMSCRAQVIFPGEDDYSAVRATYTGRWRKVDVPANAPLVCITPRDEHRLRAKVLKS
jgi:hypothetical protein